MIALGMVVLTSVRLYSTLRGTDPAASPLVLLIVIALCVVALFASGALMSAGTFSQAALLAVHRIALGVGLCSLALGAYLLGAGGV
jgi:hypothetical protein